MTMHSNQRERLSLTHVTGNHILYTVISQFICLFTYTMISHHVDKMLRREQREGRGREGKGREGMGRGGNGREEKRREG